jgi:hypothetical protein
MCEVIEEDEGIDHTLKQVYQSCNSKSVWTLLNQQQSHDFHVTSHLLVASPYQTNILLRSMTIIKQLGCIHT